MFSQNIQTVFPRPHSEMCLESWASVRLFFSGSSNKATTRYTQTTADKQTHTCLHVSVGQGGHVCIGILLDMFSCLTSSPGKHRSIIRQP